MKDDKCSSIFYEKSSNAVLSATPNLWYNIQIVRTCILKHNVPNPVSLTTRYLDFETFYCYFGHASDEVICYVSNNVEDVKKIHFPIQKCVYHGCTLGKIYQCSFPENPIHCSELLGLIHSDLLELSTLSYSKYKCMITFFNDYSSYCNIAFLYKKSKATDVVKSIF